MTVRLTTPVLGLAVGASYTGSLESWLLNEGYATTAAAVPNAWAKDSDGVVGAKAPTVSVTPVAATLAGATDAVTLTASGDVVFATKDGVQTTVTLASGDLVAAAATKIDTALAGKADAAIVSNKLNVVSNATGPTAYVRVVSGNATVLGNLGLSVGQEAWGSTGQPTGTSNTGAQADVPANDPTKHANREKAYWPATPDTSFSIANDGAHLTLATNPAPANFDFDANDVDTEAPSNITIEPNEGVEEGGTVVRIFGDNLKGVTAVKFGGSGGTLGTALDVSAADEGVIEVTTPVHAPGAVDVFLDDGSTDTTVTGGFTYIATP